jgi:methylglutaconyl-CoA hydratase
MSAYQTISIADHEAIRVITLSRPERRNALTQEMIAELTHAVVAAGADDGILVLILCGAGEAFCSGLDLAELQKMVAQTAAEQRADSDKIAAMMRALYDCPKPTVAAVNGAAVAGGMGFAISHSLRRMQDSVIRKRGSALFRQLCRRFWCGRSGRSWRAICC